MSLDPDISTEDARRLLSLPQGRDAVRADEAGPFGWSRRRFLQAVGAGVFGGAAIGTIADDLFGGDIPEAWAGTPIGPRDGILVVVTLYGGNDGLNTVVPYADPTYYAKRPNIAIAQDRVLPLTDQAGLHPELTYVKALWDAGKVAVVQGLGYPNPDLSHFTSMAIWSGGRFGGGPATSGWLGRWLDGQPEATAEFAAAAIDTSVPLHLAGTARRGLAISPNGGMFGSDPSAANRRLHDQIRGFAAASGGRGPWHDAFATTMRRQLDVAGDVAPVFTAKFPTGGFARKLTVAARLLNIDVGLRVIDVALDGFDHHENEPSKHAQLLRDLNAGLQAFYATLAPELQNRVTVMTTSEFGRTLTSNTTAGTDHGTAAPHLVIGAGVRGGMYGYMPSLDTLDRNRRLLAAVDFRSMYGSILDGWMGGGGSTILNGGFEDMRFFATGPGDVPAGAPLPIVVASGPSEKSGYVPMTPLRVFDTRDGTGGRKGALEPGESWTFTFKDRFGIPGDAVAVAVNLTSVNASEPTFVTAWPSGDARPFTANLNPVPGMAVPNLVVGRLGIGGAVSFYNNSGRVDLVADLVGYFRPSSTNKLQPLTPARLLDTRDGTGVAAPGAIGEGQSIDLVVADRGGTSADCTAVALNITVTEPTTGSFLTVWPAGQPRPLAASLNMVAGQTVPNLVISQVGQDGKVSIFNYGGSTHVVADVLGSFSADAPTRFVSITPVRALDTRDGTGLPAARIGQSPAMLQLAGAVGIPTSGVAAVLLNVTMVQPTATTYLTLYPSDAPRPLAANLYAQAGQIVPNMVIGRLGADGKLAIFNYAGDTHVVADVMGYFAS